MPRLSKKVLTMYMGSDCRRQLRLALTPETKQYAPERLGQGMPPRQPPPPGLEAIAQEGEAWQAEKLDDLTRAFAPVAGAGQVILGAPHTLPTGEIRYKASPLETMLPAAQPGQFLVEAEYTLGPSCTTALGIAGLGSTFALDFAKVRPDIIEVLPPGHFPSAVAPDGAVIPLADNDGRRQLRIIDIKLTAAHGTRYFPEVAYYTILLAGWLVDRHRDDAFVIVPDGALWPGVHDASALTKQRIALEQQGRTPTMAELRAALADDLEPVPFDIFAYRVRHFLQRELPEVLAEPDWRDLPWHVDQRCRGCDYLGERRLDAAKQPTWHPEHCAPMAATQGHLSRIAFVTRGASATLRERGIPDVPTLAVCPPGHTAFDGHQELRATRGVITGRATALEFEQAHVPPSGGTSASMPRWADLHIFLTADFDQGSALTFAFGIEAFWLEPRPYGSTAGSPRETKEWAADALIVDERSTTAEWRELRAFLRRIRAILAEAQELTAACGQDPASTSVQFYLWDALQYKHLTRAIAAHLEAILADQTIAGLAWLFPPEEVLPNPALSTRRTPITIVGDVVRAVLAAPLPHHYGLLETASVYYDPAFPPSPSAFSIHPLFRVALSDQIPSERAHEIWAKATMPRHWANQLIILRETIAKRLRALRAITRQLERDLLLAQEAPHINAIAPPKEQGVISLDGQLWYAFAKFNDALEDTEKQHVRAMPPDEREARMHSARLVRRLTGADEANALVALQLVAKPGRRVYRLRPGSREVKLRVGEFGVALAPEQDPGFLDRRLQRVVEGTALEPSDNSGWRHSMADVTQVTVVALDREALLIALDPNTRFPGHLDALEAEGLADFSHNAILDPLHRDHFTKKLLNTLHAIGNPEMAVNHAEARRALGFTPGRKRKAKPTPAAEVLWGSATLAAAPSPRSLPAARCALQSVGLDLNATQWVAWERSLSRRLQLIWGPPGTGKSRTARAVVAGAAYEAWQARRPLRILVSASTYKAIDNVLLEVYQDIQQLLPGTDTVIRRLRSSYATPDPSVAPAIDLALNVALPSAAVLALRERLAHPSGITIVGAPPQQVHNLLVTAGDKKQSVRGWFDLILIDEASQMDVAHAILVLGALAEGGSVVLAGDPKQLPPIHQADAPLGLEALVGSIYAFCAVHHGVQPLMLDVNYRSNATLVDFARYADYEETLTAHSPDLRLHLLDALPIGPTPPPGWPAGLHWTPEWSALLDPAQPATCFVYPDGRSSQWNRFEADAVAALLWLLHGPLADRLAGERHAGTGIPLAPGTAPYSTEDFWRRAVGVVTPHRAQQGLIVSRLQQVFGGTGATPDLIRDAVDTVERFQGQQRDVIVASFALGDVDVIGGEDEFLLSLNRFNVMASRARAKLIVLVSQEIVDHLSGDIDTLWGSRLLKRYVEAFCNHGRAMTLGWLDDGATRSVPGLFKHR